MPISSTGIEPGMPTDNELSRSPVVFDSERILANTSVGEAVDNWRLTAPAIGTTKDNVRGTQTQVSFGDRRLEGCVSHRHSTAANDHAPQ